MRRTVVYLSGPISLNGKATPEEVDRNIRAFDQEKMRLEREDFRVFSPVENGLDGDSSWEEHMRADIDMLMKADEIRMLPGWEQSRGSALELFIATQIGMEVSYA